MDPVSVRFQYGNQEVKQRPVELLGKYLGQYFKYGRYCRFMYSCRTSWGEPRDFFPLTVDYQERTYLPENTWRFLQAGGTS